MSNGFCQIKYIIPYPKVLFLVLRSKLLPFCVDNDFAIHVIDYDVGPQLKSVAWGFNRVMCLVLESYAATGKCDFQTSTYKLLKKIVHGKQQAESFAASCCRVLPVLSEDQFGERVELVIAPIGAVQHDTLPQRSGGFADGIIPGEQFG